MLLIAHLVCETRELRMTTVNNPQDHAPSDMPIWAEKLLRLGLKVLPLTRGMASHVHENASLNSAFDFQRRARKF
jgi:hypothetical protein